MVRVFPYNEWNVDELVLREVSRGQVGSIMYRFGCKSGGVPAIQTPFWEAPFDITIRASSMGNGVMCGVFMNLGAEMSQGIQKFGEVIASIDSKCEELVKGYDGYRNQGLNRPANLQWKSAIKSNDKYGDSWSAKLDVTRPPTPNQPIDLDIAVIETPVFTIHRKRLPPPRVIPRGTRMSIIAKPAYACCVQGAVSVSWRVHQILLAGNDLSNPETTCDFMATETIASLQTTVPQLPTSKSIEGGVGASGGVEGVEVGDEPVSGSQGTVASSGVVWGGGEASDELAQGGELAAARAKLAGVGVGDGSGVGEKRPHDGLGEEQRSSRSSLFI